MEKDIFAKVNDIENERKRENTDIQRRVSLRKYMTRHSSHHQQIHGTTNDRHGKGQNNHDDDDEEEDKNTQLVVNQLLTRVAQRIRRNIQTIHCEIQEIDVVRSASMGIWAGFAVTPGFMMLYKFLDRYVAKHGPLAILTRVASTVVYSVPNNSLFFVYGTCVHHVVEWYDKKIALLDDVGQTFKECEDNNDDDDDDRNLNPEFDAERMVTNAKLKIEAELWPTIVNSAKVWVPAHLVNFTVVPVHFRPVTISVVSIFWNCYLSLVQHRDICLEEENNDANADADAKVQSKGGGER